MPALPTARCTTSWLRFIATAGVVGPAAADVLQHRRGGARLALHLPEGRPLGAASEDDRHREEGQQEAQDAQIDGVTDQEADREEDTEGDDSHSREDKTDLRVGLAGSSCTSGRSA